MTQVSLHLSRFCKEQAIVDITAYTVATSFSIQKALCVWEECFVEKLVIWVVFGQQTLIIRKMRIKYYAGHVIKLSMLHFQRKKENILRDNKILCDNSSTTRNATARTIRK